MSYKLTYATMFDPPADLHARFDAALAEVEAGLGASHALHIDGEECAGADSEQRRSPIDQRRVLGKFALADAAQAAQAMEAAHAAFPGWRATTTAERVRLLKRVAALIEERLRKDTPHRIQAVCVVHNETSTGVTSDIAAVRRAIDAAGHPALLMVDTISGLASADYRHDEWGVDVAISGSQKGLMLPPGLGFNALSPKAIAASRSARLPRSYWAWDEIIEMNQSGYWPYTPATNLLYGLAESLDMILAAGLDTVLARHTCAHRVDELLAIHAELEGEPTPLRSIAA